MKVWKKMFNDVRKPFIVFGLAGLFLVCLLWCQTWQGEALKADEIAASLERRDVQAENALMETEMKEAVVEPEQTWDLSGLTCGISAEKEVYEYGESLRIKVRIHNRTGKDMYLVPALDKSDIPNRYPHCVFEVMNLYGDPITLNVIPMCGAWNGLRTNDFIRVPNGETFDPYSGKTYLFDSRLHLLSSRPGLYLRHYRNLSG